MQRASSSDRETNGRVSGREGDLSGGLRPAAPSFPLAQVGPTATPKISKIGTLARHLSGCFGVTLSVRVEGVAPPKKGWGCVAPLFDGPVCAGRPVAPRGFIDSGRVFPKRRVPL